MTVLLMETPQATYGLQFYSITSGSVTRDTTVATDPDGKSSWKHDSGAGDATTGVEPTGAAARMSWYLYLVDLPTATTTIGGNIDFNYLSLRITSAGVLQLWNGSSAQIGSNGSTLSTGVLYRLALCCDVTSGNLTAAKLFVNGVQDISVTGQSLSFARRIGWLQPPGANKVLNTSHYYLDNTTDLTDPGGTNALKVTAKLPAAVNNNNYDTTGGTGAVNERAISETNYKQHADKAQQYQDYTLQTAAVGDKDISGAGITLLARSAWMWAKNSKAGGLVNIVDNGSGTTNWSGSASYALYTLLTDSATYPSNAAGIGQLHPNAQPEDSYLAECGTMIAYTESAGGISANLTGTGSLAAAPTVSVPVTLAASGLGGFAAVANVVTQIAAALSGAGSLILEKLSTPIAAALSAAGSLIASATTSIPVAGTASGTGSLTADVTVSSPAAAALSGTGTLAADETVSVPIAAALSGAGSLAATVVPDTIAAALSGTGTLAADATVNIPAAAVLSGTGSLTIAASASTPIAASLTGAGAQAADPIVSVPIAASLAGSGALAGDLTVSNPVSANLSGTGTITVDAIASVPIVAALSGAGAQTADVIVTVPINAALSGAGSLAATAEETISANLSATGSLSVSVTVVAAPSAPAAAPAGGGGAVPSLLEFIRKRPAFVKVVYFPAADADICQISATIGLPEVVIPVSGRASFAIGAQAKRAQAIAEASGILRCGLPVMVSGRVECVVDAAVLHQALRATAERSRAETEEALLLLLRR